MSKLSLRRIDIRLLAAAAILISSGLLALGSSGGDLFYKQLLWLVPAALLMVGLPFLNIKAMLSYKWVIYGFYMSVLVLLVVTFFVAPAISGARSWITLGAFQIQPSEFMKAALIILLSSFFALRHVAIARLGIIFTSLLYLLIPFALILTQPDLGTALVLFGIWFGYLLVSGIRTRHLLAAAIIFVLVGAVAWNFLLADYQKARIAGLFSPEADPLGINYSAIQSKIAIGSGGLWGKGFGQGTQAHLGFLPAAHTDFVFSTFTEEWGLLGAVVLLGAFGYLIYRVLVLGSESDNNFARFVALGIGMMLVIHLVINLGSATGIMPVIGVGLPLVSYGGSNLLTVAFLLGIIQAIADRRIRT